MLQRWLHLWLFLTCVLAYFWPRLVGEGSVDPFIASVPWLTWLISGTMFCVGCLLPKDEVVEVGRRWTTVLTGTCVQFGSMPLLAWIAGTLLRLPQDQFIGLMMVGCVPGAMASNVITMTAKGNVSYSVGLTTSATIVCPIITPLALYLTLGKFASAELLMKASLSLFREVVIPVILGFAICQKWQRFSDLVRSPANVLANLAVLWIIAVVVARARAEFSSLTVTLLIALLFVNLLGYAAGYFGGGALGLDEGMRRALMIEVGMQNAGLGAKIAGDLFPDAKGAGIPCVLFAFLCVFTATLLARWFSAQPVPGTVPAASTVPE
ncbi:MAG: bile acid:sodium symporter family protein [Planctomycetaceae bacterium]